MIHEVQFTFTTEEARDLVEKMTNRRFDDDGLGRLDSAIQDAIQGIMAGTHEARQFLMYELVAGSILVDEAYRKHRFIGQTSESPDDGEELEEPD